MREASFDRARPVWAAGREREKNVELVFRAVILEGETCIRIATSGIYRLWVNGVFAKAGPARTAHGHFRMDEYELTSCLSPGENVVALEVVGAAVSTYDTLDQPSFVTAEIVQEKNVVAFTGGDGFAAYDLHQRMQKVQRYSFQRAFIDAYRLSGKTRAFYTEPSYEPKRETLCVQEEKRYLMREVRKPLFERLRGVQLIGAGAAKFDCFEKEIVSEEHFVPVGGAIGGFSRAETQVHVSEEAQRIACMPEDVRALAEEWEAGAGAAVTDGYLLYEFPYNATGFYELLIEADAGTKVWAAFDEILSGGDVDFLRMTSCNCFYYELETAGAYTLASFAPYTMKYLKLMVKGCCRVKRVEMIEYKHPPVKNRVRLPEDGELGAIYGAALESFRANALDVFMDCPSRERGGWLCDSYFTSAVEHVLTGESVLEKAFLENFLLNDSFSQIPEGMLPMCYPGDHPNGNFIPNWGMWFVLELEQYRRRSGDDGLVRQAKRAVDGLCCYFERFENEWGLLEALDGWIFVEWSRANDEELVSGVNFPTNMLYARMLQAAGELYGDEKRKKKAAKLRGVIRARSFDGTFFTDAEHRTGQGMVNTGESTEVCQYYAFFTGIASVDEDGALWERLVREFGPGRRKKNPYPEIAFANAFIGMYLRLELLYQNRQYAQVLSDIRAYFLPMAAQTGTLWEHDQPTASCNHGFASYVIYWLAGIYGTTKEENEHEQ